MNGNSSRRLAPYRNNRLAYGVEKQSIHHARRRHNEGIPEVKLRRRQVPVPTECRNFVPPEAEEVDLKLAMTQVLLPDDPGVQVGLMVAAAVCILYAKPP